jgi:hypothetical protein
MAVGGNRVYAVIGDGTIWTCHPYDANSCLTLHKDNGKFSKHTYMEYTNSYLFYSTSTRLMRCEPNRTGSCIAVDNFGIWGMVGVGDTLYVKTPTQVHACDTTKTVDARTLFVKEEHWNGMASRLDLFSRMVYAPA